MLFRSIQGELKVKEMFPDTLLLFVTTPDAATLKERLTGRGTEDEAAIRARLLRAGEEAMYIGAYDYLVVNDDLEECVKEIHSIIQSDHCRVSRNEEFINNMRRELI